MLKKIKEKRMKKDYDALVDYKGIRILIDEDNNVTQPCILTLDQLKKGDILFCRYEKRPWYKSLNRNKILPFIIDNLTGGYYTHCAIYVGEGFIIDAVPLRVRKIKLEQLLEEYSYIVVTRFPFSATLDSIFPDDEKQYPENQSKMAKFAAEQVGKCYDLCGAKNSVKKEEENVIACHLGNTDPSYIFYNKGKQEIPSKFFCSQLVMECIRHTDVLTEEQLMQKYFHSDSRTPTGLAKYGYVNLIGLIGYMARKPNYIALNDYFLTNTMDEKFHTRKR